jgi:hypothetical protein
MKQLFTFICYMIGAIYAVKWTMFAIGKPISIPVLDPFFLAVFEKIASFVAAFSEMVSRRVGKFT